MGQRNTNKKLGKTKCTHIGVRFGHPLIFRMRNDVINNLKVHNHVVFASNIIRQNINIIEQYNTEIWDKKILTKN